jgi:uncharacterized protein (DUF1697 family)
MKKIEYLALLRGINVGGKNIIKMTELKEIFEQMKFTDVKTYIQSGNILFKDYNNDKIKLLKNIQKALLIKLNDNINLVILNFPEIKEIINKKPEGFGEDNEHKYDVIYLIDPLRTEDAIKEIKTRDGVDKMYVGEKVIYISRLITEMNKSYFTKLIKTSIYSNITIRNWNTTKKLYELMEKNE